MAKLNKNLQKQTDEAESSGFEPVEAGIYHGRLREVNTDGEGPKGPYWTWEFEGLEGAALNRRFWNNTSLSPAAAFKMKETFEAFEVPSDTDTDDMCGEVVRMKLSIRTIQAGNRKGELTNQIDQLMPKDPEFVAPEGVGASQGAEDIFG